MADAVVTMEGLMATRYLSAAGLVVLVYDHILLFSHEVRIIWKADLSWSKVLFLFNRYSVPLYLTIGAHTLSGLSTAGLSSSFCRNWLSFATIITPATLGIANTFVVQRVYALWGGSRRILICLSVVLAIIYICTYVASITAVVEARPHISFSPQLRTCIIDEKPPFFVLAFAFPIIFEVLTFVLTCWNAFARPRSMQTVLIKQLYLDGLVFFLTLTSLRLFNIVIFVAVPISYVQLGFFFTWAMITALINRMVIIFTLNVEKTYEVETMVFNKKLTPPPFDITKILARDAANDAPYDIVDLSSQSRPQSLPQSIDDVESNYDWKPPKGVGDGTSSYIF